ncbi:hypothetical protein IT418_02730 [bacterium]|nr:hypothetical protein [bacterium]
MARDYGYIISPSLSRYTFEPNKVIKGTFTLTNSFVSDEPEDQAFVLSTKFVFQENGNKYIYDKVPAGRQNYDLTPWITLGITEVTIKQNGSVEIPYTITVPNEPTPGGKYAAIVIEKKTSNGQLSSSGAALDDKIAYQIIGKVAGSEIRNTEIVAFEINKPVFLLWPKEEVIFDLSFKNNGNVDFLPSGDIFVHSGKITNAFWNTNFNPEQLVILPENTREYPVSWKPQTGLFKTDRSGLTINLDYFRIGKYYATAKVGYDVNNKRIVEDRLVSFWIIPIPLLLTIFGIFLIGGIFRYVSKKKRKK